MSGIVGIVNGDGAPVDAELLRRLTEFMSFRGPDARGVWVDAHVGLGHAILRTTFESKSEQQPCSLDGQVWITADCRVDGRDELIDKLRSRGREPDRTGPDVELILHAYHAWGDDCVQHLIGDFAFGIWDGPRQRLLCARDHFGVKPFFYARVKGSIVFSNTLNCVRLHPAVSAELNDLAMADFLLFWINQELETTAFADVQRLPPAHVLVCSPNSLSVRRYWTLPENEEVRYRRTADYVEHFRELMDAAVADRLRLNRVSMFLSGGLDSPTVALSAVRALAQRAPTLELKAYTAVFERLFPDSERAYTELVATALGIATEYLVADDLQPLVWVDELDQPRPEPDDNLQPSVLHHLLCRMSAHGPVALHGNGGDEVLFFIGGEYSSFLLRNRSIGRLLLEMWRYTLTHRRLPPVGVRARLKCWFGKSTVFPYPFPTWLNPDLVDRLQLSERWQRVWNGLQPGMGEVERLRDAARRRLTASAVRAMFERFDPGMTGCPVEVRFPFFDVRLVNYLLALPPLPWCVGKELLRLALRDHVPDSVSMRPKTPLSGSPLQLLFRQRGLQSPITPVPMPQLVRYLTPKALTAMTGDMGPDEFALRLRPRKLNSWLRLLSSIERPFGTFFKGAAP